MELQSFAYGAPWVCCLSKFEIPSITHRLGKNSSFWYADDGTKLDGLKRICSFSASPPHFPPLYHF